MTAIAIIVIGFFLIMILSDIFGELKRIRQILEKKM